MNNEQAFQLVASAAEQSHLAARAAQAIAECISLDDIPMCELEALHAAIEYEIWERDISEPPRIIGQPF